MAMTEREMLELAALAAGTFLKPTDWPYSNPPTPEYFELTFDESSSSITGWRLWYGSNGERGGTELYTWNPLTDDGDALRLAVKLGIRLEFAKGWVVTNAGSVCAPQFSERTESDADAATRRAIVRAAAQIGKAMQEGK